MHIRDFEPYFYIAQPRSFTRDDIEPFKEYLNVRNGSLDDRYILINSAILQMTVGVDCVVNIDIVSKRSLWGYKGDSVVPFLKITLTDPRSVPKVRDEYLSYACAFCSMLTSLSDNYAYSTGMSAPFAKNFSVSVQGNHIQHMRVTLPIHLGL
jgi:DNA polymerase delta subunit 1